MTGSARFSLAKFQITAKESLTDVVRKVSEWHLTAPDKQKEIALRDGVMLLESPTGSGKTLTLGRTMEGLKGTLERPVLWLWFTPFSGLVAQTRDALSEQCNGLRLRDITKDREGQMSQDGDVYVQTWATVAANTKDARRARRSSETTTSFDDMIAEVRSRGFMIAAIIDEAHLNFGASATVAAKFYLEVICPDFTILATATPNDEKLVEFERKAGISVGSRVTIPRSDVVDAGLNKVGLRLGYLRFKEEEQDFIDTEAALLTAAWEQHKRVQARLAERDIPVTPLMLVQVENDSDADAKPVDRVKAKLIEMGVPADAIAAHTSGEPDPEFHTLAYDPDKQVLIFKVSAATGFDAPRAWTLVSVRPSIGKEFGLQVVGRIMRVHQAVRPLHKQDGILDYGYVFLSDPETQAGLTAAADSLQAVKKSISLVTDSLDVRELSNRSQPLNSGSADPAVRKLADFVPPASDEDRQGRLNELIEEGLVRQEVGDLPPEQQDEAIAAGESWRQMTQEGLFGDLPFDRSPKTQSPPQAPKLNLDQTSYPIRTDLGIPHALLRELPPDPLQAGDLIEEIAAEFCKDERLINLLNKRLSLAKVDLRDIFAAESGETLDISVRLSPELISKKAQLAFNFNDTIDRAQLKRAIVRHLMQIVLEQGLDNTVNDARRAVDMTIATRPNAIRNPIKSVQSRYARTVEDEPIPPALVGPKGLLKARLGAYGVFPPTMNKEEQSLAELLDADTSGLVKWWLRNPENTTWAVRIMRPSGRLFFPDFVVGVAGRKTPDMIALIEVKDDGSDGRLHSQDNREKIQTVHNSYRNVFWTYRNNEKIWVRAQYDDSILDIVPRGRFAISDLVIVS
jgi:hypothetical protein